MKAILIVDDEFDIADVLASVFELEGYSVRVCGNGHDCLSLLATERPDLVMLDVMMPGMTGLEVLKAIRGDPSTESLPVILMSAVKPKVTQDEYGWQIFLQKPFTLPTLLDAVRSLLG